MATVLPPPSALAALLAPTSRITSRVEIYEQDAVTRWASDEVTRLIEGSVSVDYSRDERRSLDLTLDNSDRVLRNAAGYFWYDKIIKVFRGVKVNEKSRPPRIMIIGADTSTMLADWRASLNAAGFDDIRVKTNATTMADLGNAEIIISIGGTGVYQHTALVQAAFDAGLSVITNGDDTAASDLPFATTSSAFASHAEWKIAPPTNPDYPMANDGWTSESYTGDGGKLITAIAAYAYSVSAVTIDGTACSTIIAVENQNGNGARWVHIQPRLDPHSSNVTAMIASALKWVNPFFPIGTWEVQIGEYMIDRISEDNFPHHTKVTGRDYAKKCLSSKFVQTTEFTGSSTLESLIASISANAGISKKILPVTGVTVNRTFSFERGTSRWDAMKQLANSYNYDVFFDGAGYLRIEPFVDPALDTPVFTFETGPYGNMVSYTKSTDDARLYNHVLVVGGSDDASVIPPWAEAKNEELGSPTSIAEIGDRLYEYDSTFITTTVQAQAVADSFLAIHQLEQFDIDLSSICLPFLEVGSVVEWVDPDPGPNDPTKFLLNNLSIPVGLGPMSAGASRVTVVS